MKERILLALTLLAVLPMAAHGQTSTWELNLHGGALRHDVFDESDVDLGFGAKLARYTKGGWGFGAKVDFVDAGERRLEDSPFDVRLLRYAAEVDKSFPARGRTRLTLGGGVGATTASYDGLPVVGDERETSLMVPVAAGLKFLNRGERPSWGLVVGARDQMIFLDDTDPLGNARDSKVAHETQGTVGLSFFFGGGDRSARRAGAPMVPPAVDEREPAADRGAEARERALTEIREPIYFDFDRSEVKPAGRETLRRKGDALRELPDVRILIEGHADERGTVEYNLALGERRARAAFDYLSDLGIDPDRMTTVSYGEERPAVEGSGEAVWSQNRRDEFVPSQR
jgi:peptidoglycan-associated lipoprotein